MIILVDASLSSANEPLIQEIPLWRESSPGSEGTGQQEIVVERGKNGVTDRSFSKVHQPTLTISFPKETATKPRPAIVICPGGGFSRVVLDKEGLDFARFLNEYGMVGLVLKYRTAERSESQPGIKAPEADAKRAIRLARFHADEWNIDPERVGIFGFSAGGFIASTAATHFEEGDLEAADPVDRYSSRPDFLGLAYPVISLQSGLNNQRYQSLLLGSNPTEAMIRYYCNDLQVTAETPATFICHARDDSGVPVRNAELFEAACVKAGVPCLSYLCDTGGHGFGIRDRGHPINQWRFEFIRWLKAQNIITE